MGRALSRDEEPSAAAITTGLTRIGSGGGFWGDRPFAPIEILKREQLDYLMIDYLAELTLSIMTKQKRRNPEAGWATDLEIWLEAGGIDLLRRNSVKLVTNAGGANPESCAKMVLNLAEKNGWHDCRVAVVTGDDILPRIDLMMEDGEEFRHLESGELISDSNDKMLSANAYLGAGPIAAALEIGADIVITGRVADASLVVGSMLHSAGWSHNAFEMGYNRHAPITEWAPESVTNPLDIIAQWTVAGHLIECGAQVSGGNSSDWNLIPDLAGLTLPIAEIGDEGEVRITRAEGTGGQVNRRIVTEQLVYEIGDPSAYKTPDVVCDLRYVTVEDVGEDLVEVKNARGLPQPKNLKVSAAVEGGWFASSSLLVTGPDALNRAKVADTALRGRLSGNEEMEIYTEFIGGGTTLPAGVRKLTMPHLNPPEIVLRFAVSSPNRSDITQFSREVAPLVLTGPGGVGGYGARPKPRRQLRFWPCLVNREAVESVVNVEILTIEILAHQGERFHYIRERTRTIISRIQQAGEESRFTRPITRRLGGKEYENDTTPEREVKG